MTNQEQQPVLENIEKPPKKCLFIDDHPLIIMGVKQRFEESNNFIAVECHSVNDALNAIRENKPDVIFLDHSLTRGGSEGIEVADQIRSEKPEIEIYSTTTNPYNIELYTQRGIKHMDKGNLDEFKSIIIS